jgi:YggT family protein
MIAAFDNALLYLVQVVFHLAMGLFMTRILLQAVRADFYNPISQMVWRATQAVATPLQRVLPRVKGRFDIACAVVLVVITLIYVEVISSMLHYDLDIGTIAWYSMLKLVMLLLQMYFFFLFVQAILSWVGPGVSNPAANILWSLDEPILRPIRRVVPAFSGLDFSPLVGMVLIRLIMMFVPLPGIY